MSIYFYPFRTADGSLIVDRTGSQHDTCERAIEEAALSAGELMRNQASVAAGGAFEIHDAAGWLVERVPIVRH